MSRRNRLIGLLPKSCSSIPILTRRGPPYLAFGYYMWPSGNNVVTLHYFMQDEKVDFLRLYLEKYPRLDSLSFDKEIDRRDVPSVKATASAW